ncbi:MAG: helix-turn-helix transcriptional regulator [Deltaproteobacteria bacterium]|nr:helix-turn-helix transcriptional regulator [Deltaproteobacteria bacterium]
MEKPASPFSDAIRQAILGSGTSRYQIAREVGVAESALSRFMSGKAGLTLKTLDRLAAVLGLKISPGVQNLKPSTAREHKRRYKMTANTESLVKLKDSKLSERETNSLLGGLVAQDAFENLFDSRRGIYTLDPDEQLVAIYNNNPYEGDPTLRDREFAALRDWLKRKGIKELAFQSWPVDGPSAGYSQALLIRASESQKQLVHDKYESIVAASYERVDPTR